MEYFYGAKHVISGFRNTGIYTHDPATIPESAMAPSQITDRNKGENVGSFV